MMGPTESDFKGGPLSKPGRGLICVRKALAGNDASRESGRRATRTVSRLS